MKRTMLLLCLVSLGLPACAMQEGDFPTLTKRPVEDLAVDPPETPAPPPALGTLPASLQSQVDAAVARSASAHAAFLRGLPDVAQSVRSARGAAPASETWVVAQMKLSALENQRSPSISALADMDALYMQRLDGEYQGSEAGGAAIIAQSRDRIADQVARQQREIQQLKSGMR